jgi:hypothetical protein
MKFWNALINHPQYQKGDRVTITPPHSEGNEVTIDEVYPNCTYKVYIPYWGYFTIKEKQIIKKLWGASDAKDAK